MRLAVTSLKNKETWGEKPTNFRGILDDEVVADGYLIPALCQIGRPAPAVFCCSSESVVTSYVHLVPRHLEMSDALLGATLLALGGSITDFMTGLVSAFQLEKENI